mmetsp:Transcript_1866/g.5433  ORF Transcript_1866/g.5433 Transcript_1866/m.5433 type:complete len:133 (+) Transcript_1866:1400-1798(+)
MSCHRLQLPEPISTPSDEECGSEASAVPPHTAAPRAAANPASLLAKREGPCSSGDALVPSRITDLEHGQGPSGPAAAVLQPLVARLLVSEDTPRAAASKLCGGHCDAPQLLSHAPQRFSAAARASLIADVWR